MSDPQHTRASRRLQQVRAAWEITGDRMAEELDVKQPTVSRILNGLLVPGRGLIFKIQALYLVPVGWWGESPLDDGEPERVPAKPSRYEEPVPKNGTEHG